MLSDNYIELYENLRKGKLKPELVLRKIGNNLLNQMMAYGYHVTFPKYPPLSCHGHFVYGVWMVGNDYKNLTKFYGAYPRGLLKRYDSMLGWCDKVLHLFSGSMPQSKKYTRFDMVQEADIAGDAHDLSKFFDKESLNLCYADPPYNAKIAGERYGTPMIKRNTVMQELHKVLIPGGLVVWLDTTFPMFRKVEFQLIGTIGFIRSTNHLVRGIFIFRKRG